MKKNPMPRIKKFVSDHKVGITFVVTALVAVKINKLALKDHEDFMRDHGILDLYYNHGGEV